jgi:hypothetical protein
MNKGNKSVTKGTCKVCGRVSELTYEHIPPKSAFNNNRHFYVSHVNPLFENRDAETFEELQRIDPKHIEKKQGGIGFYSLCKNCNTNFGTWYVRAYSDWIKQSINFFQFRLQNPHDDFVVKIYPLRVLKQIVAMFFTLNYRDFYKEYPILKRYLLSKDNIEIDPRIRIFSYFNIQGVLRYEPHRTILDLNIGDNPAHLSEITFPPLGYVMLMNDGDVDKRLHEITYFSTFKYDDEIEIIQNFNTLPTTIGMAGDYRTKEEVEETLLRSKQFKEANPNLD